MKHLVKRRPRAVLVVPRTSLTSSESWVLKEAVARIQNLGYEVVAVVDVPDFRTAHRMVADGEADVLVAAHPDHLRSQSLALDPRRPHRRPRPEIDLPEPADAQAGRPQRGAQRRPESRPVDGRRERIGEAPPPADGTASTVRRPRPIERTQRVDRTRLVLGEGVATTDTPARPQPVVAGRDDVGGTDTTGTGDIRSADAIDSAAPTTTGSRSAPDRLLPPDPGGADGVRTPSGGRRRAADSHRSARPVRRRRAE